MAVSPSPPSRRRGRPPKPGAGVSHLRRPALDGWTPAHVTLRVVDGIRSLRGSSTFRVVHRALCSGNLRAGFRLVHYTVLRNHLHLIVEAQSARALSRGIQALAIRLARGLNRHLHRKGRVFRDRYFARPLRDASAARHALRYVLNNTRRHTPYARRTRTSWVDPCSSAPFFRGWSIPPGVPRRPPLTRDGLLVALGCAGVPPLTALIRRGWSRAGPISITDVPGPP